MTKRLRWVTCSKDLSWSASQYRHLLLTPTETMCGCTASHAEIWRGNSVKPECPACLKMGATYGAIASSNHGTSHATPSTSDGDAASAAQSPGTE